MNLGPSADSMTSATRELLSLAKPYSSLILTATPTPGYIPTAQIDGTMSRDSLQPGAAYATKHLVHVLDATVSIPAERPAV
jgi:hypothetical protein